MDLHALRPQISSRLVMRFVSRGKNCSGGPDNGGLIGRNVGFRPIANVKSECLAANEWASIFSGRAGMNIGEPECSGCGEPVGTVPSGSPCPKCGETR